jgi:hypothetical protein
MTDVEQVREILQRCPDAVTSERITLLSGGKLTLEAVHAAVVELKQHDEIVGTAFQDVRGQWGGIELADR